MTNQMTNQKITRKNRDRRGGHQANPIQYRNGPIRVNPGMKAFIKKHTMKKVRRQYAKDITRSMLECPSFDDDFFYDDDDPDDRMSFLRDYSCLDDWEESSMCYDDYVCCDDYGYGDDSYSPFQESTYSSPIEYVVIRDEDVGKTIGELMNEKACKWA